MNSHRALFGLYVPGQSLLHRVSAGWKLAFIIALSLVGLVAGSLWVSGSMAILVVALLAATGVPPRRAFWVPWSLLVLLGVLFACHLWWSTWREGTVIVVNVLMCLYASRILTLTSPVPALLDAMVAGLRPLTVVGVDPERVGLAAALMIRSVPYLLGSFEEVRDATRARGIDRNILARVTPVVVNAVAYAQSTGEALAARGLGERGE